MSGGKNEEFLKDPERFLRNNLLAVRIQKLAIGAMKNAGTDNRAAYTSRNAPKFRDGQVVTVDIRKSTSFTARNANGRSIPACEVVEAEGAAHKRSHRFEAYYLPFFNNQVRTMRLQPPTLGGSAPTVYLTDEMTGCAFAAEAGPVPKVGHFNYTKTRAEDGEIDDAEVDHQINRHFGVPHKALRKAGYKRDATDHVTMVGINTGLTWTFYWQRFQVVGMSDGKYVYQIDAAAHRV